MVVGEGEGERVFFLASPPLVSILYRLCAFKMAAHYEL